MENKKLHCQNCGHDWIPQVEKPVVCPRCKNYDWDNSKKEEVKE